MYKALDTFHNFIAELKRAVQFAVYGQSVCQLTLGCPEKEGVISILQVSQMVTDKRHSGNPIANPRHQMVDEQPRRPGEHSWRWRTSWGLCH